MKQLVFISGLPRSGSTLLCNLLAQNPDLHASPTSSLPRILGLVNNSWRNIVENIAMEETDTNRIKLQVLRGIIEGFYTDRKESIIFDKSRVWPAHYELMNKLGYTKYILTVRDIPDILSSFEKLYRRRDFPVPGEVDNQVQFQTVEGRCNFWMRDEQVVGSALNIMLDFQRRANKEDYIFVSYDELTYSPQTVLDRIYTFIHATPFEHDFNNVKQVTHEKDSIYGFSNLHTIRPKIEYQESDWKKILGDMGYKYADKNYFL